MRVQLRIGVTSDWTVARRSLLAGALAAWLGASGRAGEPPQSESEEDQERRAIEAILAKAGLRSVGTTRSRHYLGVGDTSESFRSLTLLDCEAVAADYLDYYRTQGFKVAMPSGRLTVVILADESSLAAFDGDYRSQKSPTEAKPHLVATGRYEPRSNRLVVLDMHSVGSRRTGLENLHLLAHEATHQLTFNTGLLNRGGDVSHSIAEGLAQYGEIRKTSGRTAPGRLQLRNLGVLSAARRMGTPWYPSAQLLADDRPFVLGPFVRLQKLAYAQAWLLIDCLMTDRTRLEGFRAYLEAIRPRVDREHRLDDAERHLGDLDRLDRDVLTYFVRLNKTH
jgi:Protein of unknown function (DUF1570)